MPTGDKPARILAAALVVSLLAFPQENAGKPLVALGVR